MQFAPGSCGKWTPDTLEQNSKRSAGSLRRCVTVSRSLCRRMKNVISPRSTTTFSIASSLGSMCQRGELVGDLVVPAAVGTLARRPA